MGFSFRKSFNIDENNNGQVSQQHYMAVNRNPYIKLSENVNKARRVHTNFIFAIFICLFFGFGNPIFLMGTIALALYIFLNKNARQRMYVSMAVNRLLALKRNKAKSYLEKARSINNNKLVQELENEINKAENINDNQIANEAEYQSNKDDIFNKQAQRNLKGKEFEKQGDKESAAALYELNVKESFPGTHPYDRLTIIYRKQKNYEDEKRIINRAIEVFNNLYLNCDIDIRKELYLNTVEKYKNRLEKAEGLTNKSIH
jgi:tetratricopeptide (TPR) repeat protein